MIGIILLLLTLVFQMKMGRSFKFWLAGVLLGAGIGIFMAMMGLSSFSLLLNLAGAGALLTTVVDAMSPRLTQRLPFDATHKHDHIALDERTGQLWVRDISGKEVIVRKAEVQEWLHRYVASGQYKAKNAIELRLSSLDLPSVTAKFNRHRDNIWGAPKNAAEAQEWFSRLNAFLK